jgi:hypothetical protein
MLWVIPFVNGGTYSFDTYYGRSFSQIAKAAGQDITTFRIGNPRFSDALYKESRTAEQAEEDARLREQWETEYSTSEAEEQQRIGQSLEGHEEFGIQVDDFPCFVFITPDWKRVGLLLIDHRWFESEYSWRVFLSCFCSWLEQEDLQKLAAADLEDDAISRKLLPFFQKLTNTINKQLEGAMKKGQSFRGDARSKNPPKKRASRAAAIDLIKRALDEHLRGAQSYARDLIGRDLPPKLLPRPKQKQLARQLGLSESLVSRALNDGSDRELTMMWNAADNLDQVLSYRPR